MMSRNVEPLHRHTCVTVVDDETANVNCEPVTTPPDAAPHVVVCRAYEPFVTSFAVPPAPGSAVCRLYDVPSDAQ